MSIQQELKLAAVQRDRFLRIMARHVRAEDSGLSDDAFFRAVTKRYEAGRTQPLIDPNE
jgi:hypothetical protein